MSEIKKQVAEKKEKIREKMFDPKGYCFKKLGCWVVEILLDNVHYEEERQDSGYDISTRPRLTHEGFDLLQYETVNDFLNNEFTGNTIATYMSGMGLAAETHYSNGLNYCFEIWTNFINKEFSEIGLVRNVEDIDNDIYDEVFDALCLEDCGHYELYHEFGQMNLQDCYSMYLIETIKLRYEEKVREEQLERENEIFEKKLKKIAKPALEEIQNFDKTEKIEKANINKLLDFLNEMVNHHGYESVCASMKYHNFNCSLKVKMILNEHYPIPTFTFKEI